MIKVRKENVIYRIYDETKVQEFLNDGFVKVEPKKKTEPVMLNDDEDMEDKEISTKRRK